MATDLERRSERIATGAHAGQIDKAGRPYIEHPARVAARLATPELRAAGWLHDVVEDTDWTPEGLIEAGIPEGVVATVVALTRQPGQMSAAYYAQVAANKDAVAVKEADIADNSDPERLALLDPDTRRRLSDKYASALRAIGSSSSLANDESQLSPDA